MYIYICSYMYQYLYIYIYIYVNGHPISYILKRDSPPPLHQCPLPPALAAAAPAWAGGEWVESLMVQSPCRRSYIQGEREKMEATQPLLVGSPILFVCFCNGTFLHKTRLGKTRPIVCFSFNIFIDICI